MSLEDNIGLSHLDNNATWTKVAIGTPTKHDDGRPNIRVPHGSPTTEWRIE